MGIFAVWTVALLLLSFLAASVGVRFLKKYLVLLIILPSLMLNRENPDFYAFELILSQAYGREIEIGYAWLAQGVAALGGSHGEVLILLGIFMLFTFWRYFRSMQEPNFVAVMYWIYPFILDIIQVRNTFMMLCMLNSLLDIGEGRKFRYLAWMVVGILFHWFGLLFAGGLLFGAFNTSSTSAASWRGGKTKVVVTISLSLLNILFGRAIFKAILNLGLWPDAIYLYVAREANIGQAMFFGTMLLVAVAIYGVIISRRLHSVPAKVTRSTIQLMYGILLTGFLVVGCFLYLEEMSRYFRYLWLVKFMLYGIVYKYINWKEKTVLAIFLFGMAVLGAYFSELPYDDIIF